MQKTKRNKNPNQQGFEHQKAEKGTLKRLLKYVFRYNKWILPLVIVCIAVQAVAALVGSVFLKNLTDNVITPGIALGLDAVWLPLLEIIAMMGSIYAVGMICSFLFTRLMVTVTQSTLHRFRTDIFERMEALPIRYFDTHQHGDIMSTYTNDVDALRQLINQSLPQILSTAISVTATFVMMLSFSLWLTLVVVLCVVLMLLVTKHYGGASAKYMILQQRSIAKEEGFIEEMIHGQKVIKVFCHEEQSKKDFDVLNDELFVSSEKANIYGNTLMPVLGNIGNLTYVLIAFVGALLVQLGVTNVGLSGISVITIGIIISFLTLSRQLTNTIAQVSMQVPMVAMGLAGASRVFKLMDEEPEWDDGYVTLVNATVEEDGTIREVAERTGTWAWRHYHKADDTTTYTLLEGNIQMVNVDFGYVDDKIVLHDVTIDAKAGEKIALVGATGAGKTTITNLINRFYDIQDGKIRYDGININKIKKDDLRRSLGIVLQDTNLFTGTVMENIRYGKLDATDEECIAAAKLANADQFVTRLPDGYQTMLTNNGSNLSQGQRQLLSIARAAVADAPAMILDEATSSIDTRTEALVQDGMDKLMKGRTVFVIAHRLSTVRNSDCILVLDHGRVIEKGSHDELIQKGGTYYQLYTGAFELE